MDDGPRNLERPVHPVLIDLGFYQLPTYGVLLAVAAAVMSLRKGWRWVSMILLVLAILLSLGILVGRWDWAPISALQRLSPQGISLSVAFGPSANLQAIEVTDENWAILERLAHWHAAWAMWGEHPWLGVGIGNYAFVYPRYALPRWSDPLGHAHNYYLNVADELGVGVYSLHRGIWFFQDEPNKLRKPTKPKLYRL